MFITGSLSQLLKGVDLRVQLVSNVEDIVGQSIMDSENNIIGRIVGVNLETDIFSAEVDNLVLEFGAKPIKVFGADFAVSCK